ncbi:MAG: arylsulfatase [Methyloglobulus sp.]|nr:arylsulfatase [Methyloglobulus sp.]
MTMLCVPYAFSKSAGPAKDPFDETVHVADYLEPAIPRPQQAKIASDKLAALRAKTGRAPNILIIVVDDMGWGDPGVYGGGVAIGAPTPNIDRLAHDGLKLTSFYAQSLCTPSRAALMTGRMPPRSGLTRPLLTGENPKVNPWADEDTTAKLLSAAGYRTALAGKWHLGEMEGTQPHQVGYDEYFGILSVVSEMSQVIDGNLYPDLVNKPARMAAVSKLVLPEITAGEKGKPTHVVQHLKTTEELGMLDQQFADFSDKFIRSSVTQKKPFYLVHAFSRLHNDNYPAPGYAGKSPAAFPYKDAVVEVDDIVGRLMKTLKETGQLENTLVFFTSDNGANEDVWPDTGYQPWRGGKGTTWEGGVRVPGIAYWPGMIAAGRESDGLFDITDLFNTSLAVAGETKRIEKTRYIDGIDQSGFLLADDGKSARQTVFFYSETSLTAMRWQEYKIHLKVFQTDVARQNIDESTLVPTGTTPWVFNLYTDPKEQRSSGHRYFEWGLPRVVGFIKAHAGTYQKYPMKNLGLDVPS